MPGGLLIAVDNKSDSVFPDLVGPDFKVTLQVNIGLLNFDHFLTIGI
jgi:hypothetical protein